MSEDVATLTLSAMRFFGRIGHTPEERDVGTHVEVDVELAIALSDDGAHSLDRTIDYREVHDRIEALIEEGDHPLLEGLAEAILDELEALDWQRCTVRVRKPSPPIDGTMGSAQVELSGDRST
jgi:dihydroneopterin aldolase